MPMYEYICLACDHPFEVLVPASADDPGCPDCGTQRTRKRLSMFATSSSGGSPSLGSGGGGGGCCGGASGGCACGH